MKAPSPTPHSPSTVDTYATNGLVLLQGLLEHQTTALLSSYVAVLGHTGRLNHEEKQVKDSLVLYGDPMFDTVMASLSSVVASVVGRPVVPTYSFVRVYYEGQILGPHRDRRACQHSLTVHLDASASGAWPIEFVDLNGEAEALDLGIGDAALYQGCAVRHWRGPCPMEWYVQVFLHYVESDGPFADEALDGRPYLGLPNSTKAHRAP